MYLSCIVAWNAQVHVLSMYNCLNRSGSCIFFCSFHAFPGCRFQSRQWNKKEKKKTSPVLQGALVSILHGRLHDFLVNSGPVLYIIVHHDPLFGPSNPPGIGSSPIQSCFPQAIHHSAPVLYLNPQGRVMSYHQYHSGLVMHIFYHVFGVRSSPHSHFPSLHSSIRCPVFLGLLKPSGRATIAWIAQVILHAV